MSVKECFTMSVSDWKKDLADYQYQRNHVPWHKNDYKKNPVVTHKQVKGKDFKYHPIL